MNQSAKIVLKIDGMTCGHCQSTLEKALRKVFCVTDVTVDLAKKEAAITGSANSIDLIAAIEDAGYTVRK